MLQKLTTLNLRHTLIGGSVFALVAIAGCLSSDFAVESESADAGDPKKDGAIIGDDSTGDDSSNEYDSSTGNDDATIADDGGVIDSGYAGPAAMLKITRADGGFSIDSTEVTQAQYQQFILAKAGDPAGQPTPFCDFNVSYLPRNSDNPNLWDPVNHGDYPATDIDWCDAYAYCAWAGKRLCGGLNGKIAPGASSYNPAQSQWYYACSKAGSQSYPYGTTPDTNACNVKKAFLDGGLIRNVGADSKCVGGFAGISDMVGNASEWIDACDGGVCAILGGSVTFPGPGDPNPVQCGMYTEVGPVYSADDLGFRCCKD